MTDIKQILLHNFFPRNALPDENKFTVEKVKFDINKPLEKNELLLKLQYVSVDPYLRPRMTGEKTFLPPFELNKPINSGAISKIIKSNSSKYKVGEYVSGYFDWQEYTIVDASKEEHFYKVDPNIAPLSSYCGLLGMTGLTAYHGLTKVGLPKPGETVLITAAAGAVGSVVGQMSKIMGCRVVGICGSDEKKDSLIKEFGFDDAINYKSPAYKDDLKRVLPNGVDVFWENVGGKNSDPIYFHLNQFARIPVCGAISSYNKPITEDIGQRPQWFMLEKQAKMQGFLVFNYTEEDNQIAFRDLSKWLQQGLIKDKQRVFNGFDQLIPAFLTIFKPNNNTIGKIVVKVSDDEDEGNFLKPQI